MSTLCGRNVDCGAAAEPFTFCPQCGESIVAAKPAFPLQKVVEQQVALVPEAKNNQVVLYENPDRLGRAFDFSIAVLYEMKDQISNQVVPYLPSLSSIKKNAVPVGAGLLALNLAWNFRSDLVRVLYFGTSLGRGHAFSIVDRLPLVILGKLPKAMMASVGLYGFAKLCEESCARRLSGSPTQQERERAAVISYMAKGLQTASTIVAVSGVCEATMSACNEVLPRSYQAAFFRGLERAGFNAACSLGQYAGLAFTAQSALKVAQRQIASRSSSVPTIEQVD